MAMLLAERASEPSCTATAATPVNINPDAVNVAANNREGTTAPPTAMVTKKHTRLTATEPIPASVLRQKSVT